MMPRSKINSTLIVLSIILAPQVVTAQSSEPLSGLFACERLVDADAALACFRAETAKLRGTGAIAAPVDAGKLSIEPQSPIRKTDATIPKATNDNPEKFIPLKRDETPKKRTLTIQSVQTYGQNGYIRFSLENGEVWQQTERGNLRLGRSNPDKLTIKKGALGSFRARVNDKAPSIRVRRVK